MVNWDCGRDFSKGQATGHNQGDDTRVYYLTPVTMSVHRSAPRNCVVAGITFFCCGNVLWKLAGGDDAVVAGRAGAKDLQMVDANDR